MKSFGVCVVVHTLPCKHELRKLLFWRCCQHSSIPVSLPYTVLCIEVLLLHCVPMRSHEAFNSYLHSSIAFLSTVYTHTHPPQFASSRLEILRSFQFSFIVCGLFFALFSHSLESTLAHKPFISPRVRFRFRFIISFECVSIWCDDDDATTAAASVATVTLLLHCIPLNLFSIHLFSFIFILYVDVVSFCFGLHCFVLCLLNRDSILHHTWMRACICMLGGGFCGFSRISFAFIQNRFFQLFHMVLLLLLRPHFNA